MKRIHPPLSAASTELAKALLKAWLEGEPSELQKELDHGCRLVSVATPVPDDTREEERRELLEAVATRMKAFTTLCENKPMDPALMLCLDLLLHLAQGSTPIPLASPSECRPAPGKAASKPPRYGVVRLEIALTPSN
jgi:hypothetical protein